MRKQPREIQATKQPAHHTAGALALDLSACRLDQLAVGYARGAHRLARPAAEAEIQMLDRVVGQRESSFRERLDEEDAAARGIHLGAELGERGAVREAEPAVHAAMHTLHALAVERERSAHVIRRRRVSRHRSDASEETAGIQDAARVEPLLEALHDRD